MRGEIDARLLPGVVSHRFDDDCKWDILTPGYGSQTKERHIRCQWDCRLQRLTF